MIFSLDIMFKKTLAIAKKSAPPAVGEEEGAAAGRVEKAELSDDELGELEEFRRRKERKETEKLNKPA